MPEVADAPDQRQWVIEGATMGCVVNYRIYIESFQSWARLRFIAKPDVWTTFGGPACATRELKVEMGEVIDHFHGEANGVKLYHASGTKGASGAPLRIPEKHGKPYEDNDLLNPKAWYYLEIAEGEQRPTGASTKRPPGPLAMPQRPSGRDPR